MQRVISLNSICIYTIMPLLGLGYTLGAPEGEISTPLGKSLIENENEEISSRDISAG